MHTNRRGTFCVCMRTYSIRWLLHKKFHFVLSASFVDGGTFSISFLRFMHVKSDVKKLNRERATIIYHHRNPYTRTSILHCRNHAYQPERNFMCVHENLLYNVVAAQEPLFCIVSTICGWGNLLHKFLTMHVC